MMSRLTFLMLILFFVNTVSAQKPEPIRITPSYGAEILMDCDQQDAGTVASITAITAQSNDIGSTVTFLCHNDQIQVDHAGDFNLLDSPNSAQAGVGYVFFDCEPSVTGPELSAIQNDPCVNNTDYIILNGATIFQENEIWVAADQQNGDAVFSNDGSLRGAFSSLDNWQQFWFAPMTFDTFSNRGFATNPSCVNLRTDQAFSVVYLSPITVPNDEIQFLSTNEGCDASFQVLGGLPRYDNSNYDIRIEKVGDRSTTGTITSGPATNASRVEFSVPEQGTYEITVEDGKSCSAVFRLDMIGCQGTKSDGSRELVAPGDRVCVEVSVNDFEDITGVQYTIEWDETVLQYDGIDDATPIFPGSISTGTPFVNDGQLTFSWISPNLPNGVTVADGTMFYRLCFTAIGQVGDFSDIIFSSAQTPIEVTNEDDERIGFSTTVSGFVKISNAAVDLEFEVDTACFAQNNGALTIRPISGTPPYTVTYRNITTGGPVQGPFTINIDGDEITASNQSAATFEVTVTDSSMPAETFTTTVDVIERPELAVNILDPVQEVSCPGGMDGALTIDVFVDRTRVPNPDPNLYSYLWNTGEQSRVISNLQSAFYSVTVTDQYGCEAMSNRLLDDPFPISITGSSMPATCSGNDDGSLMFSVDVDPNDPTPRSYDIEVVFPDMTSQMIRSNQYNLGNGAFPGRYEISVVNDNGCRLDTFLIVDALRSLSLTNVTVANVSCNDGEDGQIFIEGVSTPGPAALPYTFLWNSNPPIGSGNTTNTQTTSNIENLRAGDYRIRMRDADGCFIDTTFMVTEPDPIAITLINKTDETCAGMDGTAEVNVTGGTAVVSYMYDWGVVGQTSSSINRLSAGDYTLTITDDNMCIDSLQFTINGASPPTIVEFRNDTIACSGDMDGELTVIANDGSAAITDYRWSTTQSGATLTSINGLTNGEYYVTVVSADGCETIDTANVVAPTQVVIDSLPVESPSCPNGNNGLAIVFPSGGTPPYTISWRPGTTGDQVEVGLTAGSYAVTITDANQCTPAAIQNFTIVDPPSIVVAVDIINPVSCFGATGTSCDGSATATATYSDGSPGTFDFTWPSGEVEMGVLTSTATQLCAGNQQLVVSDGTCNVVVEIMFPSRDPLSSVVEGATPVSCFGRTDGEITIRAIGGEGPYTFDWLNLPTGVMLPPATGNPQIVPGLPADTFFVNITDNNNCTFSSSVIITEPGEFIASVDVDNTFDVECPGGDNGQIAIITDGGNTGNISYQWTPSVAPNSSPGAFDLTSGIYSILVTDGRGCQSTVSHTINEPPPITFTLEDIPAIQCFGFTTSINVATVDGGNGGSYAYSVDQAPLQDISFGTNVFSGPHIIEIFDSRNCSVDTTINITQPNPVVINIDPVIEVELGDSMRLLPQFNPGGAPINNDSIFWTPGDQLSCDRCPDPIVRPFEDQSYLITAYDVNGCVGDAEVFIEVDKNRNVFLPNAFSPNGDGINDEFRVFTGVGVQNVNYVRIFDRWGNLIYEQTDIEPDVSGIPTWDGFFQGKPMDPYVYVYLIEVEFEDEVTLLYRGDITLMR